MQLQLCLLLCFCSVINSSGYSLLFKHPMLLKPYLGDVFPQHMLEFTASAAALQSTFGFFHPQTVVLIRGGFPLLSRGGQAQQLAFCRDLRGDVAELSPQVGSMGGPWPWGAVCLSWSCRRDLHPLGTALTWEHKEHAPMCLWVVSGPAVQWVLMARRALLQHTLIHRQCHHKQGSSRLLNNLCATGMGCRTSWHSSGTHLINVRLGRAALHRTPLGINLQ